MGLAAVQLAKATGARVIAVARGASKMEVLREARRGGKGRVCSMSASLRCAAGQLPWCGASAMGVPGRAATGAAPV